MNEPVTKRDFLSRLAKGSALTSLLLSGCGKIADALKDPNEVQYFTREVKIIGGEIKAEPPSPERNIEIVRLNGELKDGSRVILQFGADGPESLPVENSYVTVTAYHFKGGTDEQSHLPKAADSNSCWTVKSFTVSTKEKFESTALPTPAAVNSR